MKKSILLGLTLGAAALLGGFNPAYADGWPANYQGVMLQGFYWDSYDDSRWTVLESQADELSQYFSLIWVPNSGRCGSGKNMGYMPQYWFTNHNSSFGTEKQLLSMIATYKAKGVGIIADCVINHRNGVNSWSDFPTEEWDGKSWHIGLDGICKNDEMANASGQPKPTGANDTGDNFDGCRDLDHTNANVQDNCKNYVRCLHEKYGYAGVRYDMVKGYAGRYTKIYNQYANVKFSVGEYWDGNYDAVKNWIEATGKTSAAFDFPCKYAINEAFHSSDMRKLVWKANGVDQPAGMIHFGYQQYAVTFIDNHDTYRDGSKFNGNVVAANAFILMSPGTPCVFLPHYKANKAAIQTLINIRNAAGIHNQSAVTVLRADKDCYMAEVKGTKSTVVVKIGSAQVSPAGYSDSDIKASGNGYCVWTKASVQGGGGDDPNINPNLPDNLYLLGEVNGNAWDYAKGVKLNKNGNNFSATVELTATGANAYFSFTTSLANSWDELNSSGCRFAPASDTPLTEGGEAKAFDAVYDGNNAKAFYAPNGKYDILVDWPAKTVRLLKAGSLGVEEIFTDEFETPIYFNLQGVKVENPEHGVYIRVVAGKAQKVML